VYEGRRLPFANLQDLEEAIKNNWKEAEQYNIIAKLRTFFMSHPVLHNQRMESGYLLQSSFNKLLAVSAGVSNLVHLRIK